MSTPVAIFIVGAELIVTAFVAFFSIAALGFAGEATRSRELNLMGWVIGVLYFAIALTPFISSVWVAYRRFFSKEKFPVLEVISSPYWIPIVLLIGAFAFCVGLLAFQNGIGLTPSSLAQETKTTIQT